MAPGLRSQERADTDVFPGSQWAVAADVETLGWSKEKLESAKPTSTRQDPPHS